MLSTTFPGHFGDHIVLVEPRGNAMSGVTRDYTLMRKYFFTNLRRYEYV